MRKIEICYLDKYYKTFLFKISEYFITKKYYYIKKLSIGTIEYSHIYIKDKKFVFQSSGHI
jgi:hypothetical protein